ncbi:hypothetical protein V1524DRAFT_442173, partial [Lipomyces starkeyi]
MPCPLRVLLRFQQRSPLVYFTTFAKMQSTSSKPMIFLIRYGRFFEQDVPQNLKDIVLGECDPSHVLSGSEILATTVDFFRHSWFES